MRLIVALLECALLAGSVRAQEAPKTEQRVADLERRLEALSQEVEAQKTGGALPAMGAEGRFGLGASASKVYEAPPGLSLGGYGEFLYENKGARLQDGTRIGAEKVADVLRVVLYTGYKFSDRIVFNAELEFEHGGYSDDHPAGEVVVEFAYLDFLISKAINLRVGQVLVPLGFINELHEPPAFLGARRPQVEGNLIPTTWHENGLGLHGDLGNHLSYRFYLVNGLDASKFTAAGIREGRQAGKEANAQSLAWTGRLDWIPWPGFLAGASFYSGNSNQSGGGRAIPTTLWDAHAEYRARGFQFRGLYTRAAISAAGLGDLAPANPARAVGIRQWGGYLEAGYDMISNSKLALIPYCRYERINAQERVLPGVLVEGAEEDTLETLGVAFKPIPQVVVKTDWTRDSNRARRGRDQFSIALGYTF